MNGLQTEVVSQSDGLRIVFTGRLDALNEDEVTKLLSDEISSTDLVAVELDCANLSYISSAGLRVVLKTQKLTEQSGKSLKVVNPSEMVREVFTVTGLDEFLN